MNPDIAWPLIIAGLILIGYFEIIED